ncbi:MAG TPA: hypothetical protein VGJ33_12395 [Candidatus Angelobacter sp.]|jgi:hypothetical protein
MDALAKRKSHRSLQWLNLGLVLDKAGLDKMKATRLGGPSSEDGGKMKATQTGGLISKEFYRDCLGLIKRPTA